MNRLTKEESGPTTDVKCANRCYYTSVNYCAQHTRHRVRIKWNALQHRAWRIQYVRHRRCAQPSEAAGASYATSREPLAIIPLGNMSEEPGCGWMKVFRQS